MILGFVGTFPDRFGAPPCLCVHTIEVDGGTGRLTTVAVTTGLVNPSFLALHPVLPRLYAVERDWSAEDETSGALTTFAIASDGRLTPIARTRSGGRFSSHISLNRSGTRLFIANPRSASVSCLVLRPDGVPNPHVRVAQAPETAEMRRSTNGPWTHSAFVDNEERRVFACDFGSDRISIFDLDERGELSAAATPSIPSNRGSGPRHLAFHPDGRHFYVINERDSSLSVYANDAASLSIELLQTISTVPDGGSNKPAEIHVTDRFVYCSNRGHDSIVAFAIERGGSSVRPVSWQATGGESPRHFAIDTQRGLALVANQRSGSIVSFWLDDSSGTLVPTGQQMRVPDASCVVIGGASPSRRDVA